MRNFGRRSVSTLLSILSPIAVTTFALAIGGPLSAQRVIRQWFGTNQTTPSSDAFGIVPLGADIDADGVHELVLASPYLNIGSWTRAGRMTVLSGRTWQVLHDRTGSQSDMFVGSLTHRHGIGAIVDGDGDKKLDIPIYHAEGGVHHFSPLNGQTYEPIDSSVSNEGFQWIGDVDGDGISDRILGVRNATPTPALRFAGKIVVTSGATGRVIYERFGTRADQGFGAAIRATPDLDGDRVPDFLVHSISGVNESVSHSLTQILSGRTGLEIPARPLGLPVYGSFVSVDHDLNGDGHVDVVAYVSGHWRYPSYGRMRAFAGPTYQTVLFDITRPTALFNPFGSFYETCSDVDGDGCDDLVVREMVSSTTFVFYVLSGRDQSELFRVVQNPQTDATVFLASAHGDFDGDGFPDFVSGVREIATNRNRAELRSGAPDGVDVIGRACFDRAGRTPRIGASHRPEPGATFHVNLSCVVPGQSAWLMLGTSATSYAGIPLPADLAAIGLPGCDLSVSPDVTMPVTTTGVNDIGRAIVPLSIPNDPALRGGVFHAQWLVIGRGGVGSVGTTTRALRVAIQ